MTAVQVIDAAGAVIAAADPAGADLDAVIAKGEALHRVLRPRLPDRYCDYMRLMIGEGAHVVHLVDGGEVRALAVWRAYHTTYHDYRCYIDDLVTAEQHRSLGYGATLLNHIVDLAEASGCAVVALDSATHRHRAHAFYDRQGFRKFAYHFVRPSASAPEAESLLNLGLTQSAAD